MSGPCRLEGYRRCFFVGAPVSKDDVLKELIRMECKKKIPVTFRHYDYDVRRQAIFVDDEIREFGKLLLPFVTRIPTVLRAIIKIRQLRSQFRLRIRELIRANSLANVHSCFVFVFISIRRSHNEKNDGTNIRTNNPNLCE